MRLSFAAEYVCSLAVVAGDRAEEEWEFPCRADQQETLDRHLETLQRQCTGRSDTVGSLSGSASDMPGWVVDMAPGYMAGRMEVAALSHSMANSSADTVQPATPSKTRNQSISNHIRGRAEWRR
jgi:hypothetical protein